MVRTSDRKLVSLVFESGSDARALVESIGESLVDHDGAECVVEVSREDLRARLGALLELPGVLDFTVEDEPIERVMERVFQDAGAPDTTAGATDGELVGAGADPS
jgi:hypothetical protein